MNERIIVKKNEFYVLDTVPVSIECRNCKEFYIAKNVWLGDVNLGIGRKHIIDRVINLVTGKDINTFYCPKCHHHSLQLYLVLGDDVQKAWNNFETTTLALR